MTVESIVLLGNDSQTLEFLVLAEWSCQIIFPVYKHY